MSISRLILTLALTATIASPALARDRDDDDDDDRRYGNTGSYYGSSDDSRDDSRSSGDDDDDNDNDGRSCTSAPRAAWLSVAEIASRARQMGYAVSKIEMKGSCYEVYASKGGSRRELYFDPATGKVVKWEDD